MSIRITCRSMFEIFGIVGLYNKNHFHHVVTAACEQLQLTQERYFGTSPALGVSKPITKPYNM